MLFNSLQFAAFFVAVTGSYFAIPHKYRWGLLLGASCLFYMAFVPYYILILGFIILVDYVAGRLIENATNGRQRRVYLLCSIVANVGILVFFKYFHFLSGNLAGLSQLLGWNYAEATLAIILPIGLSFHTFQAMSYTIEVFRGRQKAERHLGIYALYVMFYPQLVAGPIERPQHMLHQFRQNQVFDYLRVTEGLKLMVWGLFKKVMIADRLAPIVDQVYRDPSNASGPGILLATVLFAFQIFSDFSGYSDIAVGAAKVMGFTLLRNFQRPYFATSIPEFWRHWHISLSTWFRDYLYIPLGGSKTGFWRWQFNIAIVFVLSGLWHGASWNFVIWGAIHAAYMIFANITTRLRVISFGAIGPPRFPRITRPLQVAGTFGLVCFAWIFFRAPTTSDALSVISQLPSGWGQLLSSGRLGMNLPYDELFVASIAVVVVEIVHLLQIRGSVSTMLARQPALVRWTLYTAAIVAILIFGKIYDQPQQFIYFQF